MRISDWSSDVCSSDLRPACAAGHALLRVLAGVGACADGHWGGDLGGTLRHLLVEIVVCLHMHHDNAAIVITRFAYIHHLATIRSEASRVGTEGGSSFRSRWWPKHKT